MFFYRRRTGLRLFGEVMGMAPFRLRLSQAKMVIKGDEDVPKSIIGLSSLKQLHPRVSPKLWRGKFYIQKAVIISNLYNHTQTPIENGWSVERTQIRDFRGKQLTYDSHNGTDFAIPVGTAVYTAAAGKVVAIKSDFHRGGLKVFIDHGQGLLTSYNHLAKAIVSIGDVVARGQQIAISGYSGIDGAMTYMLGIPHVHFNVWLNGLSVDPFSIEGEVSLWNSGWMPTPATDGVSNFEPTMFDAKKVANGIAHCKNETVRKALEDIEGEYFQAMHLLIEQNYFPTRFNKIIHLYDQSFSRKPMLDLPFSAKDFDKCLFIDEFYQAKFPRIYKRKYAVKLETSAKPKSV
jgi:murein DD-endopeptidase MepM/ murein hydrolase activator NlpD